LNRLEGYDSSIQYDIANPIVTVFGKEAVINYEMQCCSSSSSSDKGGGDGKVIGSDDVGGVKVDSRIVVRQTRKWELSNGKWLQTI
jgi:hypothetical protein